MKAQRPSVLFVAHTSDVSGPTHSLHQLVVEMAGEYNIGVVAPGRGVLAELIEPLGARYHVLRSVRFSSIPALAGLIRREGYDLVYGNNPSRISRNALVAAKLSSRPFIWHFRGIKSHWGFSRGIFIRWADHIVAVSEACAEPLRRFRPQNDIAVIHNGVRIEAFEGPNRQARADLLRELGISEPVRLVLTASHLTPRKGIGLGLDAIHAAACDGDLHWLIAGSLERDPAFTRSFKQKVQSMGLGSRVHLLGLRSDVSALMSGSDLFLHPAIRDPHPRAVIEAMASGLAVVAFDVDGVGETVEHGVTGLLADKGDTAGLSEALRRLLSDAGARRSYGKRARRVVTERFSSARTARSVSALVDSCLRPSRAGRNRVCRQSQASS